ncbi:MAG: FMN-dependent monooxygenase [Marmoricola sp.]|jgi:alkanesulfonate monooxygenase SsuD/methylene tetrahydromethanopterin reductase-like flavin-dependent oxidoreductase (luciferase family)|nr:FMN-dependent monooxygenase [Marmoricola sp.]
MTINAMVGGGRIIAGVGGGFRSSAEGWHGVPWGKAVRRMRDYVDVLRRVFHTAGSYDADGNDLEPTELYAEPVRAHLGATVGSRARHQHPVRRRGGPRSPPVGEHARARARARVVLAAVGPQMIALTAEVADGWFPWGFVLGTARIPHLAAQHTRYDT